MFILIVTAGKIEIINKYGQNKIDPQIFMLVVPCEIYFSGRMVGRKWASEVKKETLGYVYVICEKTGQNRWGGLSGEVLQMLKQG